MAECKTMAWPEADFRLTSAQVRGWVAARPHKEWAPRVADGFEQAQGGLDQGGEYAHHHSRGPGAVAPAIVLNG